VQFSFLLMHILNNSWCQWCGWECTGVLQCLYCKIYMRKMLSWERRYHVLVFRFFSVLTDLNLMFVRNTYLPAETQHLSIHTVHINSKLWTYTWVYDVHKTRETCLLVHVYKACKHLKILEMWANAQPGGRPAEYRWRPLLNAAVWLTPTTRVQCSNAAKTRNPLKLAGVPQTNETISAASRPKFTILWAHLGDIAA